jgi:DNA-binding PadR family transcriptional regulator
MPVDGSLDPTSLILVSLAAGPKHGHAIMLDVAGFAGRRLGPGTLYGAIGRLEDDGLIEPLGPEDRRRPYRLTARGREEMSTRVARMSATVAVARERMEEAP